MTLKWLTTPLLAGALVLGGCEVAEEPEPEPGAAPADDTVEAVAPTLGELMPINQSEVRGRAEAVRDGEALVVEVEAGGLTPDAEYAAFLHEDRCAEGGPVRLPLGSVVADEDGAGSARLSVERVESERAPAGAQLSVQLHGPDDQPVACADLAPGEPES